MPYKGEMEEKEIKIGLSGEDMKNIVESEEKEHRGPQGGPPPGFDPKMMMRMMGDARFDVDAYFNSPDAKEHTEGMAAMRRGEDTPATHEYWANFGKGMKKELHNAEDPLNKWASYLPLAAVDVMENGGDRVFPLIFLLHGAHNPILMTEGYGMTQVAAREECIVIAPENENEESILALLEYAKEHWPVDASRVYLTGYSFGGCTTSRNGWKHPELFAGLGWGGMLFGTQMPGHELDGMWYPEYEVTEEDVKKMEALEMPVLLFMGENEMLELLPLWRNQSEVGQDHVIPLQSADKHQAFNNFRRAGGCAPVEFKEQEYYENHEDPVVRSIGADFEYTEIFVDRARKYFIGDSLNAKGENLFRTVAAEKMHHSATRMWAEFIWEHLSGYARDTETGKLIRLDSKYTSIYR